MPAPVHNAQPQKSSPTLCHCAEPNPEQTNTHHPPITHPNSTHPYSTTGWQRAQEGSRHAETTATDGGMCVAPRGWSQLWFKMTVQQGSEALHAHDPRRRHDATLSPYSQLLLFWRETAGTAHRRVWAAANTHEVCCTRKRTQYCRMRVQLSTKDTAGSVCAAGKQTTVHTSPRIHAVVCPWVFCSCQAAGPTKHVHMEAVGLKRKQHACTP